MRIVYKIFEGALENLKTALVMSERLPAPVIDKKEMVYSHT